MPMIDVTYPQGTLSSEQRQELVDELTTVLLRAEGAPDTDFFRDITWVWVHELPGTHVLRAGQPVPKPTFKIDVTTPQGALSDRRREQLVNEGTEVVRRIAGIPEDEALRVWILCREIDEGSWGAGGQIIQFEQLREAAKAQREAAAEPSPA